MTNRYRVYSIIHPGAIELVEASSNFVARQNFATKHRLNILDCVARREWERTQPVMVPPPELFDED
jgi:hypothetical protein